MKTRLTTMTLKDFNVWAEKELQADPSAETLELLRKNHASIVANKATKADAVVAVEVPEVEKEDLNAIIQSAIDAALEKKLDGRTTTGIANEVPVVTDSAADAEVVEEAEVSEKATLIEVLDALAKAVEADEIASIVKGVENPEQVAKWSEAVEKLLVALSAALPKVEVVEEEKDASENGEAEEDLESEKTSVDKSDDNWYIGDVTRTLRK